MKIRLSTYNTPLFREGGFQLTEGWKEYDLDDLTPEQKDLLEAYTGRIIQVAPDQLDELAAAVGLEQFDGKLRYPGKEDPSKPALGTRHQVEAGEMLAPTPAAVQKKANPAPGTPVTGPTEPTATERPVQPQPVSQVPTHIVDSAHSPKKPIR